MKLTGKSRFTEYFIKANGLSESDFDEWMLSSEMLFEATDKWWGTQKKRKNSHEGIDLGFYRSRNNGVVAFNDTTNIPIMYTGVIVGVFNDFLGKSVFLKHEISDDENGKLCTIFGHIKPDRELYSGMMLKEGETIARVASVGTSNVNPHLHITIGWAKKAITEDLLNWNVIGNSEALKLIDPIEIIGRNSLVPISTLFPK